MKCGNELFEVVNNWLGWGDPENGVWFIGVEEGAIFDKSVSSRKGKRFSYSKGSDFKVANTTAKVVAKLLQNPDWDAYRDDIMWRKGSRVFNGNLFPLGKPNIQKETWPKGYLKLVGVGYDDYQRNLKNIVAHRQFKSFREEMKPQAIVCFGKRHWSKYKEQFVQNPEDRISSDDGRVEVYESDKVILTGHFSWPGRHISEKDRDFVAAKLTEWAVDLGK